MLPGGSLVLLAAVLLGGCSARSDETLQDEFTKDITRWQEEQKLPAGALPGAKVFAQVGCLTCHTYGGSGSSNLGARDLTDEGARKSAGQIQAYVADPPRFSDTVMPRFEALGPVYLRQLAVFLAASRGPR